MYYLILGDVLCHDNFDVSHCIPFLLSLKKQNPRRFVPAGVVASVKSNQVWYLSPKYSFICASESPKYFLMSASTALSRLPSLL